MANLPAICAELCLRAEAGVPVVNSRDVAELFEKDHKHVLRDIDGLLTGPNLGRLDWFRAASYRDAKGEDRRSFDLTRDGFTLLVNRWTGEKALRFQIRYIEAFNAMEKALNEGAPVTGTDLIKAIREIVAPLAVRFDGQDRAIERVEARVDGIAQDMASIKARILNGRIKIKEPTKREHVDALNELGRRCPCCSQATVIVDGQRSQFAEFDHFYQSSKPDADHTWLICKPCHNEFTYKNLPRDQREAEFRAYQQQRRRLPGRQIVLF